MPPTLHMASLTSCDTMVVTFSMDSCDSCCRRSNLQLQLRMPITKGG